MKHLMVAILLLAMVGTASAQGVGGGAQSIMEPGFTLEMDGTHDTDILMWAWSMSYHHTQNEECASVLHFSGSEWNDHRLFINDTYSKAEERISFDFTVNISKEDWNRTINNGTMRRTVVHGSERVVDDIGVSYTPNATRVALWFDENPVIVSHNPACGADPVVNDTVVNDTADPPVVNATVDPPVVNKTVAPLPANLTNATVPRPSNDTECCADAVGQADMGCGIINGPVGVTVLNETTGIYYCDFPVIPAMGDNLSAPDPVNASSTANESTNSANDTSTSPVDVNATDGAANETDEGNATDDVVTVIEDTHSTDNTTVPSSVANDTIVNASADPARATPGFGVVVGLLSVLVAGKFKARRV